ncbi:complex I subunit 5 family protein [Saliniramus sp.]|uniref:complex I subunit 5 family protein n=1 Tax=Saliniramus sp. TaxID=2986772 RepID=UPI002C74FBBE|nr:proton-conducting transporter membrane subunit [Saliniramus sp.]HMB09057.1 proton-conducting transporter membrane subunit [Saliniramus sp.]
MTDSALSPAIALALILTAPLFGALAAMVTGRRGAGIALATMTATGIGIVTLLVIIAGDGDFTLAIGGWEPPLGIQLRADGLAAGFITTTALVMGAILAVAGKPFGAGATERRGAYTFWPLALLLWGALNAIFLSGDLFNLYVGLELLTLVAVALVGIEGKRETLAAALRYMMFALMGSLLYLLGAALLYAAHGTLDIALLAARVGNAPGDIVAAAAITAGLAAKTALFPFHSWLPPAHSGAPAPASAMLSGLVPKASFYILLRFWFEAAPDIAGTGVLTLLGGLGALAMIYGSLLALHQNRLKLIIAYSTVAQLGYLFFVFPLAGGTSAAQPWAAGAWSGAVFHALSHAMAKASMFLCAGLIIEAIGHDRLPGMKGIVRAMPMTVFAFALAAITLMGLPPSGGFTAKYLMMTASFAAGQPFWALMLIVAGLLAAAYLYRPLALAFALPDADAPVPGAVSRARQAAPLVLALAAILLGILSAGPFAFIRIGRPGAAVEGLE